MRKVTVFCLVGLCATMAVMTVGLSAREVGSPASETTATTARMTEHYRTVGAWEGKLAVFLPGRETPERVYDVRISSLPQQEQERLNNGIAVLSASELLSLIEDYTG